MEEKIAALGTDQATWVLGLFDFFRKAYRDNQGFQDPPVHDPCTVAYLINPDLMSVVRAPIHVELTGTHTRGMTVCDFRAPAPEDCHTAVALRLDHAGFWDLVIDAIRAISK